MLLNKLEPPFWDEHLTYLYEGKNPDLFEDLTGETLNRVPRQIQGNVEYIVEELNKSYEHQSVTGGLIDDWVNLDSTPYVTIKWEHLEVADLTHMGIVQPTEDITLNTNDTVPTSKITYFIQDEIQQIIDADTDTGRIEDLDFAAARIVEQESPTNVRQFNLLVTDTDVNYSEGCGNYADEIRDWVLLSTLSPLIETITFYVSRYGQDTNSGTSSVDAFLTLQHCLDTIRQRYYFAKSDIDVIIRFASDYEEESDEVIIDPILNCSSRNRLVLDNDNNLVSLNHLTVNNCYTDLTGINLKTVKDLPALSAEKARISWKDSEVRLDLENFTTDVINLDQSELELKSALTVKVPHDIVCSSFINSINHSTLKMSGELLTLQHTDLAKSIEFHNGFLRFEDSMGYIAIPYIMTTDLEILGPKYHLIRFSMLDTNQRGASAILGKDDGILEAFGCYLI